MFNYFPTRIYDWKVKNNEIAAELNPPYICAINKTFIFMKLHRHNNTSMSVHKEITIWLPAVHFLLTLIKLWVVLLGYSDDFSLNQRTIQQHLSVSSRLKIFVFL